MNTIINCKNIVRSFGEGDEKRNVLDGVSMEVREGEFVAVMGPSGSGKTTLMFALSGMDQVDGGKVFFDGRDVAMLKEKESADLRRQSMGFVFQQPTLLKNLNILDNILLPSVHRKKRDGAHVQHIEKARELMKRAGISELEQRDITQASGGQLQRAGICRAMMGDPKIIFGDEPTGALNSKAANEIMDLLADIHRSGTAILLVTHDVRVAARASRVLYMLDGRLAGEFTSGEYEESGDGLREREERLSAWLVEMKF